MNKTKLSPHEARLARVRALMEWTLENGCTEGEVEAAAAKVKKLMAEYGLSPSEIKADPVASTRHGNLNPAAAWNAMRRAAKAASNGETTGYKPRRRRRR